MARYYLSLEGAGGTVLERDFPSREAARDGAVVLLGEYLQRHPEFACHKHWRVDVRDADQRLLLHVIVATVDAPPPLNFRSIDG